MAAFFLLLSRPRNSREGEGSRRFILIQTTFFAFKPFRLAAHGTEAAPMSSQPLLMLTFISSYGHKLFVEYLYGKFE